VPVGVGCAILTAYFRQCHSEAIHHAGRNSALSRDLTCKRKGNATVSLAEEYRRKEKPAEALAKATQDEVVKETYLEVAERWRRLVDWAERHKW